MIDVSMITSKRPMKERTERIRAFSTNYLVSPGNLTVLKKLSARYGKQGVVYKEIVLDDDLVVKVGDAVVIRRLRYTDRTLGAIVERVDGKGAEEIDLATLLRTTISFDGVFVIPHRGKNLRVVGKEHPYHIPRSDVAELIKAMLIQCVRIWESERRDL